MISRLNNGGEGSFLSYEITVFLIGKSHWINHCFSWLIFTLNKTVNKINKANFVKLALLAALWLFPYFLRIDFLFGDMKTNVLFGFFKVTFEQNSITIVRANFKIFVLISATFNYKQRLHICTHITNFIKIRRSFRL